MSGMRKAFYDVTNIYQERRFLQPELDRIVAKRNRNIVIWAAIGLVIIFLATFAFGVSKVAISLYDKNLEQAGIIMERDMRIAILAHQDELNPVDLVLLAKTIHGILNTANGKQRKFLEAALPEAIRIQIRFGIPASAVLAQSAYESGYGDSGLAKNAHNYFGLKALGNWKGEVYNATTKDFDKSVTHVQPFRKFPSLYEGFKGYVDFINQPRYKSAFKQSTGIGFIRELANSGYCPDASYSKDVNTIMVRHRLSDLDKALKEFVNVKTPESNVKLASKK